MTSLHDRPAIIPPTVLLAALLALADVVPLPDAHAQGAPDSVSRLAPTSDPPWKPPAPAPHERRWETVARAPGEVVSFPLSMLGLGMKATIVYAEENDVVPKAVARLSLLALHGLLIGPSNLGDHTGWGAEVGVSPPFFRYLTASVSGTTSGYNRTDLTIEAPQGKLGYRYAWRPSDPFFGLGSASRLIDESNFALKSQIVRLELRYPFKKVTQRTIQVLGQQAEPTATIAAIPYSVRAWAGPRDLTILDGREQSGSEPPLSVRFPALASKELGVHVEHLVYGLGAAYDTRTGRPHWSRGWRFSSSVDRFDRPVKALALRSARTPSVPFTRLTHEGEVGFSFWRDPRTLRFYARVEDRLTAHGPGVFPLADLATLGGGAGLYGFDPGRFRDADLMLGRITYIFPLVQFLEGDLHAEAGNVMGHLGHARLDDFVSSYGAALRVRTLDVPVGSVGVDWSRETLRLRFALGGVE